MVGIDGVVTVSLDWLEPDHSIHSFHTLRASRSPGYGAIRTTEDWSRPCTLVLEVCTHRSG